MIVVSDDLNHDNCSVYVFMNSIIDNITIMIPDLAKLYIFSDGCAAQFKNRYTLSNLLLYPRKFNINATWSFFATSHGKGAVDGIGGTAKREV